MSCNRFFTADHHFGHTNILKYEDGLRRNANGGRFQTVEDMDTYLVDQWNATVSPDDTVYHLGDISYKYATIEQVLPFLNGKIYLIVGNHDPMFKQMHGSREQQANARDRALQIGFAGLHTELTLTIPGIGLVFSVCAVARRTRARTALFAPAPKAHRRSRPAAWPCA